MKGRDSRLNLLLDEVIGIILVGLGLLLIISLLSYESYDTPYHASPPNQPLHNLAGKGGAYLSETLYFYLGWAALLLPVFMLFWGFMRFCRERERIFIYGLGGLVLIFSLSSLFSLFGISEHFGIGEANLPAGGFLGSWMARYLVDLLGPLAYMVTLLGILLGYTLGFGLSLTSLFQGLKRVTIPIKPMENIRREYKESGPRILIPGQEKREATPIPDAEPPSSPTYQLPDLSLLDEPPSQRQREAKEELLSTSKLLEETLAEFGVEAKIIQVNQGPTVTRFELQPAPGVKVARIVALSDDIALTLATPNVRIETPIPGKQAIGIEIPNRRASIVYLREILETPEFSNSPSKLAIALGKDLAGQAVVIDLTRMPHLLIAGATGSGKSICINTIITSILYRASPKQVKLMLIDPKRVEFVIFEGIPHLITPIITDAKKSAMALKWLVNEMEERYKKFAEIGVRDIEGYNQYSLKDSRIESLPYIVMIIDELADLMMVALNDCEDAIIRLAQMARAVGIHLVLATQRPSVDVITGLIKANLPSRIAFKVSSKVDSRTILDMNGAEKLIGAGDMLFAPVGSARPMRIQGSYISLKELERVVDFIKRQGWESPQMRKEREIFLDQEREGADFDELYQEALKVVARSNSISASMLQRRLRIGYNRAARLIEALEEEGIVSPPDGAKPRRIYHDRLK